MSWQAYVDANLVGTGKVAKAAILGLKGGVWASTPGYALSTEEQKAIVNGFDKPHDVTASGLRLHGQKFFALRADKNSIQLKKGGDGAILARTKQAVLVAEYVAPIQAPEANPIVEGLAEYLRSVGY